MVNENPGLDAATTEQLLKALAAIRHGDFATQMLTSQTRQAGEVAEAVNAVMDQLQRFAVDVSRLAATTSVEGNLGAQMSAAGATGIWADLTDNLNHMSLILAAQVRDIARVAGAVAEGDLSQKVTIAAAEEMGELKATFNLMEQVKDAGFNLGHNADQD